jgi:hypothetical protein
MIGAGHAVLVTGALAVLTGPAYSQESRCPGNGVTYTEQPERGPYVDSGRTLTPSPGGEYGVDLNSTIKVMIDGDCIARLLGGTPDSEAATAELRARIDSLTSALRSVRLAINQLQALFRQYAALGPVPDQAAVTRFDDSLKVSAQTRTRIFTALRAAVRARLLASGLHEEEITREVARIRNAGLTGPQGYDWEIITNQLEQEVAFVRATLGGRGASPYGIELRAAFVTADGQYPIPLSGYNEEQACAAVRVEPIQLDIPQKEAELYQDFDKMVSELRSVRGLGNAILAGAAADLSRLKPEMDTLFGRAKSAVAPVETAATRLTRWSRPGALQQWLGGFKTELAADPDGRVLTATADSLRLTADALIGDLSALRSFASLRDELATADAPTAMAAILARAAAVNRLTPPGVLPLFQSSTWTARQQLVQRFLERIDALAPALRTKLRTDTDGPVADAKAAVETLKAAADSLGNVSRDALELLSRVLGLPPASAASKLAEPRGLIRRALEGDLNTEIRLKELCQPRKENDQVRVEVRVFRSEERVLTREDRFRLRLFGWRGRVAAGVAFYQRRHGDIWQPGASLSWIFTHSSWPKAGSRGLGDPAGLGLIGLGLTTVNLHFENEQAIELGIGPSVSFFNDRVMLGAGWNLQAADDQLYWLLSIRLLDVARTH